MRPLLAAFLLLATPALAAPNPYAARVARVLRQTPLIDGHNDWAEALAEHEGAGRWTRDLRRLDDAAHRYHTDIARLRAGSVGGVFWSVWVSADLPEDAQVHATLDQIDLVHRIVARYPEAFALATTAADVRRIHAAGRIASLIGVEGGGQIAGDLSVLRAYRALGASYLTLTHFRSIDWADSATDDPRHDGLAPAGVAIVRELNRLGMLVDLSHVSEGTMRDAIAASKAPVLFSHSGARAVADHPRNVSDAVLRLVGANGGVVMVDFYPGYVSEARRRWGAERAGEEARLKLLDIGDPVQRTADLARWDAAHPKPRATLSQVADHIAHVAHVAGIDHVGIGSDFDGMEEVPEGLEGVSSFPALLAEMMRRGWSDADAAKLAGGNVLRVMAAAERTAEAIRAEPPGDIAAAR